MRHRKNKYTLDRNAPARKALLKGLLIGLINSSKITTTSAKAKAVRPLAENIIYWGKVNDLHSKRMLRRYVDEKTMKKLISDIVPKLSEKKSGYTRITSLGFRHGDGASISVLEYLIKTNTALTKQETTKPAEVVKPIEEKNKEVK